MESPTTTRTLGGTRRPGAAPRDLEAARARERRHLVEALRMARHDDEQHLGRRMRGERVEQQRLLALARAARDPHAARARRSARATRAPRSRIVRGHLEVELHVAGHRRRARAPSAREALRVGLGLRRDAGEVRERPARERAASARSAARSAPTGARWRAPRARRARAHSSSSRGQSSVSRIDAELGAEVARGSARTAKPMVVGQPRALDAVAEELLAGGAARWASCA